MSVYLYILGLALVLVRVLLVVPVLRVVARIVRVVLVILSNTSTSATTTTSTTPDRIAIPTATATAAGTACHCFYPAAVTAGPDACVLLFSHPGMTSSWHGAAEGNRKEPEADAPSTLLSILLEVRCCLEQLIDRPSSHRLLLRLSSSQGGTAVSDLPDTPEADALTT